MISYWGQAPHSVREWACADLEEQSPACECECECEGRAGRCKRMEHSLAPVLIEPSHREQSRGRKVRAGD